MTDITITSIQTSVNRATVNWLVQTDTLNESFSGYIVATGDGIQTTSAQISGNTFLGDQDGSVVFDFSAIPGPSVEVTFEAVLEQPSPASDSETVFVETPTSTDGRDLESSIFVDGISSDGSHVNVSYSIAGRQGTEHTARIRMNFVNHDLVLVKEVSHGPNGPGFTGTVSFDTFVDSDVTRQVEATATLLEPNSDVDTLTDTVSLMGNGSDQPTNGNGGNGGDGTVVSFRDVALGTAIIGGSWWYSQR